MQSLRYVKPVSVIGHSSSHKCFSFGHNSAMFSNDLSVNCVQQETLICSNSGQERNKVSIVRSVMRLQL